MFRRIRSYCILAALALLAGACTKSVPEELVQMQFCLNVDASYYQSTRAATGQGTSADICIMEIFYGGQSMGQHLSAVSAGKAGFSVPVVAGRTYQVAFWACKSGSYNTASLQDLSFAGSYDFADDTMEAFSASLQLVVPQNPSPMAVTLTRALSLVTINKTSVSTVNFSAPASYNVVDGTFGQNTAFYYTHSSFYLFAPETATRIDFTIDGQTVQNVPVRRNYKTNINFEEN